MPTREALDVYNLTAKSAVFKRRFHSSDRCMRCAHRLTRANCTGNRHASGHTGAAAQSRNGRDTALCTRPVGSSLHIAVGDDHGMIAESN